jgi:hypothetical protein
MVWISVSVYFRGSLSVVARRKAGTYTWDESGEGHELARGVEAREVRGALDQNDEVIGAKVCRT